METRDSQERLFSFTRSQHSISNTRNFFTRSAGVLPHGGRILPDRVKYSLWRRTFMSGAHVEEFHFEIYLVMLMDVNYYKMATCYFIYLYRGIIYKCPLTI